MLDELKQIDWNTEIHAYGVATNIPNLIVQLISAEEDQADNALDILSEQLCHQGQIYPLADKVTPILISILRNHDIQNKVHIIKLLDYMTDGIMKTRFPWYKTHETVADNVDLFLEYFQDSNATIRFQAFSLLANSAKVRDEDAPRVFEAYHQQFLRENDEANRRILIYHMSKYAGGVYSEFIQQELKVAQADLKILYEDDSSNMLTKLACAVALTTMMRDETPVEISNFLLSTINNPPLEERVTADGEPYQDVVYVYGLMMADWIAIEAIYYLGLPKNVSTLLKVLDMQISESTKRFVADRLIQWGFFRSNVWHAHSPDTENLTPIQLRILQTWNEKFGSLDYLHSRMKTHQFIVTIDYLESLIKIN